MNILVYILILLITAYFWYQRKYGHRNRLLLKFRAPKSWPILNHGIYFINKSPVQILELLTNFGSNNGNVWRFDLTIFTSLIQVQDPEIAEKILSSQKLLDKADEYKVLNDWLGNGLLLSTGKKWHQRRKIITPTFHFKILEEFLTVMETHGNIFVKKLKKFDGRKIDVFPLISLYALDVICESAMGYKLNAQMDETSEYVKAVKEISTIKFEKIFNRSKNIKFLYQFTNFYKREKETINKLHNFTKSVISARRKALKHRELMSDKEINSEDDFGVKKKTAFLDLLLQVKVENEPLSDESIREEVDTFMFEGHDTTTSAIAFTLLNLARYPDIQKRVFDECQEVFADDQNRSSPMQNLNNLNYLEKVIKETLRLYPSVTAFSRKFQQDEKIGDYTFPANVAVRVSPYMMGRDPNLFPNPYKFDPSRFDVEKNIKLFSYVPFSAGARNCIGQKFAMLEMKSIISKIVRNFEILIDEEDKNPLIASELILRPVNGIDLKFKDRN